MGGIDATRVRRYFPRGKKTVASTATLKAVADRKNAVLFEHRPGPAHRTVSQAWGLL